ncbi:cell surface protein [Cystobacter fuscus]|uniref:cell surface protein n=1 Tax=Cystobacter fuscus TaxID=43 RepID=UPI002B31B2D7|nr:cell surface protein [Cystobacter fuscus]
MIRTLVPRLSGGTWLLLPVLAAGCGGPSLQEDTQALAACPAEPQPFADHVVSYAPGPNAGFGQDAFPGIVLGPPHGEGAGAGSLDVLSLGRGGEIVLEFTDIGVVDGPGVDLLVFENVFISPIGPFSERGIVSVSEDGQTWHEFPCASTDAAGGYPGCAGTRPVYSSPTNGVSATDLSVAGGDGFDLTTLGVPRARFVRVRDAGNNPNSAPSSGFDLDAVAVVNGYALCQTP